MSGRITRDELYMGLAHLMSLRSTCGRKQVGAVLVKEGRVISCGYNGSPSTEPHCLERGCNLSQPCQHAFHAERNAIEWAYMHHLKIEGVTMYVTLMPCKDCAARIISTGGIHRVVFRDEYREKSGILLLKRNGIRTELYQDPRDFNSQLQNCTVPNED